MSVHDATLYTAALGFGAVVCIIVLACGVAVLMRELRGDE